MRRTSVTYKSKFKRQQEEQEKENIVKHAYKDDCSGEKPGITAESPKKETIDTAPANTDKKSSSPVKKKRNLLDYFGDASLKLNAALKRVISFRIPLRRRSDIFSKKRARRRIISPRQPSQPKSTSSCIWISARRRWASRNAKSAGWNT